MKFGRAHFVWFAGDGGAVQWAVRGYMRLTIRKSFRALDPFGKGKLNVFYHTRRYIYYVWRVCILLNNNIKCASRYKERQEQYDDTRRRRLGNIFELK